MASMNFVRKLPPTPLLLPGAALVLAAVLLVATLLVQGQGIRDSRLAKSAPALSNAGGHDAPLPPTTPSSNLGQLANSELFGHFDAAKAAQAHSEKALPKPSAAELGDKAPAALPEAALALKLQGIIYKQDPAKRRAIIAGDGPSAEARKIGETLLGDAVIRYIEARRVVVEQQGQLKALTLLEPSIGAGGASDGNLAPMPMAIAMPGNVPAAYVVQPMQAVRRSVMEGVLHQPQPYVPPAAQYEPPPEDVDSSAPVEEPPADDAVEPDQSEPTE